MLPIAILAGGLATRLGSLTAHTPKALIEVQAEPFIAHQLRLIKAQGITHVVLCVGYLGEQIQNFVGNGASFGLHVEYSFDGDVLLGTAGALKKAQPLLGPAFFVMYGDSYLPCDFKTVAIAFDQQKKEGLMTVFHNQGQGDTSNIAFLDGKIMRYDKFHPTSDMHYIDYGLGILTERACSHIPSDSVYDLAHLYEALLQQKELAAYEVKERFYEIGSVTGISGLTEFLK